MHPVTGECARDGPTSECKTDLACAFCKKSEAAGSGALCTSCPTGKVLKSGLCVDPADCDAGQWGGKKRMGDVEISACVPCFEGCATCNK